MQVESKKKRKENFGKRSIWTDSDQNFQNFGKHINPQIQKAKRIPSWENTKNSLSKHIIEKPLKNKVGVKSLKQPEKKMDIKYKGITLRFWPNISTMKILLVKRHLLGKNKIFKKSIAKNSTSRS